MKDRVEVVKGLETCSGVYYGAKGACSSCPYCKINGDICFAELVHDATALLKEQEARVMALDELTEIYVEFKGNNCPVRLTNFDLQKIVKHAVDGDCRLWTGKPTDEQRQAVKWE